MKKISLLTLGITLICCLAAQAVSAITITEIKQYINDLPLSDFSGADNDLKSAIQKQLDAISDTLTMADTEPDSATKVALKQDAIDNLNVLKNKNSGCNNNGVPGIDASITDCTSEQSFYNQLNQLINELSL